MSPDPDLLQRTLSDVPIAVLDLEMTGLDPDVDRVCEVAVVRTDGVEYQTLVRPEAPMSKGALKVHGLTADVLADAPSFATVAASVREALEGCVVVAHNAPFDLGFLHREYEAIGQAFLPPVAIDTLVMSRRLFAFPQNNLGSVCGRFKIELVDAHRALADARATLAVYKHMVNVLDPKGTVTVGELLSLLGALAPNSPLRLRQQRMLRESFEARSSVFIDYQSSDSPLRGLVHREVGIWLMRLPYIQAWCYLRKGERVFRLDRIREVAEAGRDYEIPSFEPRI